MKRCEYSNDALTFWYAKASWNTTSSQLAFHINCFCHGQLLLHCRYLNILFHSQHRKRSQIDKNKDWKFWKSFVAYYMLLLLVPTREALIVISSYVMSFVLLTISTQRSQTTQIWNDNFYESHKEDRNRNYQFILRRSNNSVIVLTEKDANTNTMFQRVTCSTLRWMCKYPLML